MATELLLNSTEQEQWSSTPVAVNHTTIDEGDPQNEADFVQATAASCNRIDIYGLPDTIDDVDEVTQIVVNVYYVAYDADESPAGSVGNVDIDLGGYQGAKTLIKPYASGVSGWKVLTWAGLSGSQADLDGLEIKLSVGTLNAGKYIGDFYTIYSMYIEVTYTPTGGPAGWGHKINSVLNANIGKINGVLKANIGKVNGV